MTVVGCTLLVMVIGFGDWVTGIELPFTILYLMPIALGTWFVHRRCGVAMAALATCWLSASLVHEGASMSGMAWNVSGATLLFCCAGWAIDRLHHYVDEERSLRQTAVAQLRHAERLNVIGKLAAGIAHELGTPLSIVGGHAQMIAGGEVTGEAALASARSIDAEATRMSGIVRQLLDFARRKGPEGTSCDPNTIAHRCTSLLAPLAERARVTCEVQEDLDARVLIDEASLQQVVTNLAVNAIQAMPDGGALSIAVSRTPDHIRIDVADTGTGIAAEVEAHLFEPFVTTKAPGDGTGLGLAVVHGIVVDHRGWITVATGAQGTTFSVHLQEAA